MGLISLSTLTPTNSLAAVRFSRPVHVSSLRIVPSSLAPFPNLPDFSAETEPSSFSLEVFFNWQTLPSGDEKPRASNILLHSTLEYTGDELEYEVDPSEQLVTRLLIIKGSFSSLTLAVYGRDATEPRKNEDVELEPSAPLATYEPVALPTPSLAPLPPSLDPRRITDPLALPQRLLSSTSSGIDILDLMARQLSTSSASSNDITLEQVLNSYEIGEDWLKELIDALEGTVDPSELTEPALQDIEERLVEIMGQSPSPELLTQLISALSHQAPAVIDNILPIVLGSAVDRSIYLALANASSYATIANYLSRVGLPTDLDSALQQRIQQNIHMWDNLREGHMDMSWVEGNIWEAGFLPAVLDALGANEDFSSWSHSIKLKITIVGLLSLISGQSEGEDTAGRKAAAILHLWLSEEGVIEILKEAITHQNVRQVLSTSDQGSALLEKIQNAQGSAPGHRNGAEHSNGHESVSTASGDLNAGAAYLTTASKSWPSGNLQQLQISLHLLLTAMHASTDKRPITHSFWRQNTSAVQCVTLILLEASRRLAYQNWELSDSGPARELVTTAQASVQVLQHMVPEFGIIPGMIPPTIQALVSLLISLRQPTYATRYSSEPSVRVDCERLISKLSEMDDDGNFINSGADIILPVLLQESLRWEEGVDPSSRLTASADLLIALLDGDRGSTPQNDAWAKLLLDQLPSVHALLTALDAERSNLIVNLVRDIDDGTFGMVDWLALERLATLDQDGFNVSQSVGKAAQEVFLAYGDFRSERSLRFVQGMGQAQLDMYIAFGHPVALAMANALWSIWDRPLAASIEIADMVLSRRDVETSLIPVSVAITIADTCRATNSDSIMDILPKLHLPLTNLDAEVVHKPDQLLRAIGAAIAFLPEIEEKITMEWQRGEVTLEAAISLLETALSFFPITEGVVTGIPVPTLSEGTAARFKGLVEVLLGQEKAETLTALLGRLSLPLISTPLPGPATTSPLTGAALRTLVQLETARPPSTPLSRPLSGLDGGLRTAPPSAQKSPPVASLAKTYSNNDFRELRTLPQARLNTSRPPSRHVDDFEHAAEAPATAGVIPLPAAGLPAIPSAQVPIIPATNVQNGGMPFYPV